MIDSSNFLQILVGLWRRLRLVVNHQRVMMGVNRIFYFFNGNFVYKIFYAVGGVGIGLRRAFDNNY